MIDSIDRLNRSERTLQANQLQGFFCAGNDHKGKLISADFPDRMGMGLLGGRHLQMTSTDQSGKGHKKGPICLTGPFLK
jgi:hypothetical protein